MLYNIDTKLYMDFIPYEEEFNIWRNRLTEGEYNKIFDELNTRIEGDEIHTSSWIPGSDWAGTVFEPIYERACQQNMDSSAKFFGLILWEVIRSRDDVWSYGRYEKNGFPIKGLTYFKLLIPPERNS